MKTASSQTRWLAQESTRKVLRRVSSTAAVLAVLAAAIGVPVMSPEPDSGTNPALAIARADCPPDCGGGPGNGGMPSGPPGGGTEFVPPSIPAMPSYDPGRGQPPLDQNNGISIYNSAAPQPSQAAQPSQAPVQNQDGSYSRAANGEQQPVRYSEAAENQQINSDWKALQQRLSQNPDDSAQGTQNTTQQPDNNSQQRVNCDSSVPGPPPLADGWTSEVMHRQGDEQLRMGRDLARMIEYTYTPDNSEPIADLPWKPWTDQQLEAIGLSRDALRPANGLRTELLTDGQHTVMAIAGARRPDEGGLPEILGTVIPEALGEIPPELRSALDIAQRVVNAKGAGNVLVTGHSMGGGHATVIAEKLGIGAVTFQSEGPGARVFQQLGINPCEAWDQAAQGQIVHYAYGEDPLATLTAQIGAHTPYGKTYFVQEFNPGPDEAPVGSIGRTHDIATVGNSLATMLQWQIPLPPSTVLSPGPLSGLIQLAGPFVGPALIQLDNAGVLNPPAPPPPAGDDGGE